MKLDIGPEGITIAAEDLGPLLDLAPDAVPPAMRRGDITSIFETGEHEDADRFRVTFRHGKTRLRLTCAQDGTVLSHIRTGGVAP